MIHHSLTAVVLAISLANPALSQHVGRSSAPDSTDSPAGANAPTLPNVFAPTKYTLRTYCIFPEEVFKVQGPRNTSDCGTATLHKYSGLKEIWLRRPGSKCCVAIVHVEADGTILLNPKGFAYGPIPALRDLTPAQADELWGTEEGKFVNEQICSYKLASYNEPEEAIIDLVFKKNKLQKYRVRSTQIPTLAWTQVQ